MLVLLLGWIFLQCVPGRCDCGPGYDGLNCTRKNLAFCRRTSQSSTYKYHGFTYLSGLAVDGRVDTDLKNRTCTHTHQKDDKSFWNVYLGSKIQSNDIEMVIYLRNLQGRRYKNFTISIDGALCQEITDLATADNKPPTRNPLYISNCTTPLSGSRVTIAAATGDLTLCEVQIWECIDGYFGSCDRKCNCYAIAEICDKTTGACPISGCHSGTYGLNCQTECPDRRYGRNCSGTCGRCRNCEPCNKISGECSGGCEPGYRTPLCDTECPDKSYGRNCSGTCGYCKNSETCNKKSGECSGGCEPGYRTPMCDTEVADAAESTAIDVETIAFTTTVCVLVVIIVILTVIIIRMKLQRRSSDRRSPGIDRPIPDTHRTIPDTHSSSTPATYEPFQLTEDNQYTCLERPNLYVNI